MIVRFPFAGVPAGEVDRAMQQADRIKVERLSLVA